MVLNSAGFELGLHGSFDGGSMVEARPVDIDGYSCTERGTSVEPIVGDVIGNDFYTNDASTTSKLTSQPLLVDPLEQRFVEVQQSLILSAGEGLFLRRDAKV